MLVDELYRKNVCYIVAEYRNDDTQPYEIIPVGTAFFMEEMPGNYRLCYAVTARHVIEETHQDPDYRNMFFRANKFDGTSCDIPVRYEDWVFHPDTDVAVCRTSSSFPPTVEAFSLPTSNLVATMDAIPGQDVFFIGLFQLLPGERKVDAIVRFGKVAHPLTKVPIRDSSTGKIKTVDAYLVEARSWGGESGSPVFIHDEHYLRPGRSSYSAYSSRYGGDSLQTSRVTSSQVRPHLLGLLYGHFEIPQSVTVGVVEGGGQVDLKSGIAVVIPASRISETLGGQRFVNYRQEIKERLEREAKEQQIPKPDAAL